VANNDEMRVSPELKAKAQRLIKPLGIAILIIWLAAIGLWYVAGADANNFWPIWLMWILGGALMLAAWAAYSPAKGQGPKRK
jgi:fatty acid desaturase